MALPNQPDSSTLDVDGPIPEANQPGHHPDHEQDKPDLDRFAEKFGIVDEAHEPASAPDVSGMAADVRRRPIGKTIAFAVIGITIGAISLRAVLRRFR